MNPTRKIFILTLICLFYFPVFSQSDPDQWEMDIVVKHPSGMTDTLTIGLNKNGGPGVQPGMDVVDTNFTLPLSIRSYDPQVEQLYNTCPANMRRDIRAFNDTVVFTFYVVSDTFPAYSEWQQEYPDSMVLLIFDSAQHAFQNENWIMNIIFLYVTGGYVYSMDGDYSWIYWNDNFSVESPIPLIHEGNPWEYWGGPCNSGEKVLRFDLVITLDKITNILDTEKEKFQFINDMANHRIMISALTSSQLNYVITDINGRVVKKDTLYGSFNTVSYRALRPGIYILSAIDGASVENMKFIVH